MERGRIRSAANFITGAVVFVISVLVQFLDNFQRLDYLKQWQPQFYSWIVSPTVMYGTTAAGIALMIAGLVEMRKQRLAQPKADPTAPESIAGLSRTQLAAEMQERLNATQIQRPVAEPKTQPFIDGPIVHFERSAYGGLRLRTDREICNVSFADVERNGYKLHIQPIASMKAGTSCPVMMFGSGRSGTTGGENAEALTEEEGTKAFEGKLELDLEYWDLRRNKYSVRWLLTWGSARLVTDQTLETGLVIRRDPASYRCEPGGIQ